MSVSETLPEQAVACSLLDRLKAMGFLEIATIAEHSKPALGPAQRITLYQNWLLACGGQPTDGYAAWYNLGVLHSQQRDYQAAISAYRHSLTLRPGFNPAVINLGLALEASGDAAGAATAWSSAMQPDEERTALLNQQGRLLETLGKLDEAERILYRSLLIQPQQPDVIQHWVHLRQKTCRWPLLESAPAGLNQARLMSGAGPLASLALTDDPALQCEIAASWIARKTTPVLEHLYPPRPYGHDRLRIGYLSSDFCNHAMSYLIAGLLEKHDRSRFEIFAYCATREDQSDIRRRILAAFDTVRLIADLDDERAARLIRQDEIDILVDLNGLTAGSRIQILRWRPAPIQATYLGFVGPVPLPELDALLCDEFVVPAEFADHYLPRPHPIQGIYQANDTHRAVAAGLTRQTAGLPLDAFVFCCFCGHFKITEAMFSAWMSILRDAPDSVLWLADDNQWSRQSLQDYAAKAGIRPERLVFAPRCAPELYMARLALADLFLDTFPYTAGTVASDAIRMRLPILTLPGRSFASRMAARLLDIYGAPTGIASSLDDYVSKAVALATTPTLHAHYRDQFQNERWDRTLGDISGFTKAFENGIASLYRSKLT